MEIKNTDQIRETIIEEIQLIKKGESNPARANAIANLIGKLLSSVKLDIEVHKYVARASAVDLTVPLIKGSSEIKK